MSIWDFSKVKSIEDCSKYVKEVILSEAERLNEFTKGKVIAEFSQIQASNNPVRPAPTVLGVFADKIVNYENASSLKDASKLYNDENFGFEIHNKSYKFRVFEIKISASFPMEIKIDSDIYTDEVENLRSIGAVPSINNTISISSKDILVNSLACILNNRKVMYIISRMLSDNS